VIWPEVNFDDLVTWRAVERLHLGSHCGKAGIGYSRC
jgi:hypothetical protein